MPLAQQKMIEIVWIREEFIYSQYDFGKKVIFGHTLHEYTIHGYPLQDWD